MGACWSTSKYVVADAHLARGSSAYRRLHCQSALDDAQGGVLLPMLEELDMSLTDAQTAARAPRDDALAVLWNEAVPPAQPPHAANDPARRVRSLQRQLLAQEKEYLQQFMDSEVDTASTGTCASGSPSTYSGSSASCDASPCMDEEASPLPTFLETCKAGAVVKESPRWQEILDQPPPGNSRRASSEIESEVGHSGECVMCLGPLAEADGWKFHCASCDPDGGWEALQCSVPSATRSVSDEGTDVMSE